jgi:hypothetical protein
MPVTAIDSRRIAALLLLCSVLLPAQAACELAAGDAWKTEGPAEVRDSVLTLREPAAAASMDAALTYLAERRFLCRADLRSDDGNTPACISLRVRTSGGASFDYRLFEHCQLSSEWARFTESVAFPDSAVRLVGFHVSRGAGQGSVQVRDLRLSETSLRFDHRPRPLIGVPQEWGPTRPPAGAELLYRPGLAAVSCDAWVPIIFSARSKLPLRTVASLYFDLPENTGDPFVIAQGHPDNYVGKPQSHGAIVIGGQRYQRYSTPTNLYYAQSDGQALLFLKPSLAPGKLMRLGYFVEWEGGRQPERWLDAEVISIPAGPNMHRSPIALAVSYPWATPQVPGFPDLLRRTGITALEIGDIVGYDDRRQATFDYLRRHGIQAIGGFSPGFWWPYETALATDDDMQAKGIEGEPVPTDHGPAACPSYRGPVYGKQMDLMRVYARYGLTSVSFDEEFFGPGTRICFCQRCRELFAGHREERKLVSDVTLEQIAREPKQHPELARAWVQFKADLTTEWYRDYRRALEEELAKTGHAGEVRMYATGQTLAYGAGEVELLSIMRDNATRLAQGLIQGLLAMPYFHDAYYGGSLRKVGQDLMDLQKLWGPHTQGRPSLFPYLLTGGAGTCYVEPQKGVKYQMYEAFTTGAVSGCIFWYMNGLDGYHYRHLAEAIHALAKVEDILAEGKAQELKCAPESAAARAVVRGDQAVVLVTEYGYDPVRVSVAYPVRKASVVEDVETGATIARVEAGGPGFQVEIRKDRARLLRVRPR